MSDYGTVTLLEAVYLDINDGFMKKFFYILLDKT